MDRCCSLLQGDDKFCAVTEDDENGVSVLELVASKSAAAEVIEAEEGAEGEGVYEEEEEEEKKARAVSRAELVLPDMTASAKHSPSMRSSVRSAASVVRLSAPSSRRSPSPSIGPNNLRARGEASRSASATRSSKHSISRSPSLTKSSSITTENSAFDHSKSSSHSNTNSSSNVKSKFDSHSRNKALQSLAPATNLDVKSSVRGITKASKLSDGPLSPSAKDKHQRRLALDTAERSMNVPKRDITLRSSGGLDRMAGGSASRRHSLSATVVQRAPSSSIRKSADSRPLQNLEIKSGEDVRLDLRGHNLWRIDKIAEILTSKLEFVYLRDNKISSMDGLQSLRRVKVLDLSFNELKGDCFEALANCKALQQLYLAGNQITSLASLPLLPNLEFLSVAQNELRSLTMASQPKLQVLAASSNKISTFRGFPYLPLLEHLRLEANPILDIPHVEAASILVVGETLKRFNNHDLSFEEQKLAVQYPPHTAICLREGWDFCELDYASESTLNFLVAQWRDRLPPGFTVKKAAIDPPSEEDCCSCCFVLESESGLHDDRNVSLTYQWFLGDKTATNFWPIEGARTQTYWPKHEDIGHCLKVECKPIINGTEFSSIFAVSTPVTAGRGCPKVLSLRVDGELIEERSISACAEVAWCGGTPGKAIVSWLRRHGGSSPVAIMGAEGNEYQLTIDDVGANLLVMYTPVTEEGVKGESQFATTALVQAAAPSVIDVHVIGPLVEGATIKGTGRYFGGREGKSMFKWFREDKQLGGFKLVSEGAAEYCLSNDDVGSRIMFTYIPRNIEGFQGDPASITTNKIMIAPPKVMQLKILGDIREGNVVSVSATIVGGAEEASRVQWFKAHSREAILDDTSMEAISSSKIMKEFHIPVGAVGYYLAVKFTPGRLDGECGEPALVFSEQVVEMLPPSLTYLSLNGKAKEGEILTASYGYIGGHEGTSEYNWYLHEDEHDSGCLITSATGLLQYEVSAYAVNKFISFRCTPVRKDSIAGESRSTMMQERVQAGFPKLTSLQISGNPIEGAVLHVDRQYFGGIEGTSKIQWILKKENNIDYEIPNANFSSYRVRKDDVSHTICVTYEPVREDGVKGAVVTSQAMGPILPGLPACESLKIIGEPVEGGLLRYESVYTGGEIGACKIEWYRRSSSGKDDWLSSSDYLDLTSKDVGCTILLVFTPVRKDGTIGAPYEAFSDVIKNADPVGLSATVPDCCEGVQVVPKTSYYGGTEGCSEFRWFRLHEPLDELNLPEDAVPLSENSTYTPSIDDVGMYMALRWTPIRSDGRIGKPIIACSDDPVAPAYPRVTNVKIKRIGAQKLLGQGDYSGGSEGKSMLSWFRESIDGTLVLIEGAISEVYTIIEEDYMHKLVFEYTPVREDGVVGERVLSAKSEVILPEIPRPLQLLISGDAVEGELLTSAGVLFDNEADHLTWEKYKKDVRYQWLRSSSPGSSEAFVILPLQRSTSYKIRSEDVGYVLRCECVVTDIFNRSMNPVIAMTPPVLPGIPKIDKVEIEGRGYHTNLYAVRGIYSGGKEGKSMIQWFRAVAGRPDLVPIIGEIGRMYEANVDDIGSRLVAVYTPVREDGIGGTPVSASTELIAVEPEVAKEVKQKLELGAVKFEALRDREQPTMKGLGSLERRILDVNKKRFKVVKPGSKTSFPNTEMRGTYAAPFRVDIIPNDQHRFKIFVDSENEVDLMVQTRHIRDVIVLVLRGFANRFHTLQTTLLKP